MSTTVIAQAAAQRTAARFWTCGLVAILKRRLATYNARRAEQAAIGQLWSMSDRELKDIGLTRVEIQYAVSGEAPCERAFVF